MRHDDVVSACVRTSVKSFDELISEYRADIKSGPLDEITGTQLVGKGKKLKDAAVTARQLVTQYLHKYWVTHGAESLGWHYTRNSTGCCAILLYSSTQVRG